jgi:hypothetical protein
MTALRIQPGAHEIFDASKLEMLMPVDPHRTRQGRGGAFGRELFASFPTLEAGDTVGFIPYPIEVFGRLRVDASRDASRDAALRRNRETLKEFTASWAERFPRSARAQEAVADAFEAHYELGEGPAEASAAIRALDSAVTLVLATEHNATRSIDVVRLRAHKVRFHFKRGEFVAARILADSILRTGQPESYDELQWVAALIGRADLVAHFWKNSLTSNAGMVSGGRVHPAVAGPANKYFAYAALGICEPHLSNARAQLESALGDYLTRDIRDSVRSDLTDRAAMLATPCTKGKNRNAPRRGSNWLTLAQVAFGRGDSARARGILVAAAAERSGRRPGDLSADYVFQAAWLRTQVGDTAAAVASLDAALGALPTFGGSSFEDVGVAASFARAMALRSEIATKRGEAAVARRWAVAVNELWASADPPLRNTARELMQSLGPESQSR